MQARRRRPRREIHQAAQPLWAGRPQGIHEGQSKHQLSYVEMTLANNPNTQDFYLMAARWANAAEPARMRCQYLEGEKPSSVK